jgi:tetratricopeptide (TPR) repeat protein
MNEIPLTGNIKDIGLPKILISLNRHRKTGTLIIKNPVFTKKIFFVKGDAVFASSTYEDDRLGEMLLKSGKITLEQYDKSVELLKKTGKRQGAILVELGYITPKDLFNGVKYQVKEIIYSLFLIEDGEYEFIEEIPKDEVITLKMSMGNLIYEGVKRIDNWTRIKREMPSLETVLTLSNDPLSIFQDIELSPQDRKMLSIIDGTKTIKELINNAWISSFEAMKILYVLLSIKVLEEKNIEEKPEVFKEISVEEILQPVFEDESTFINKVDIMYSKISFATPEEILEIESGTDIETIKKNYYRLTKEYHPDRQYGSTDPSLKDKLEAIFNAINVAYETLTRGDTYNKSSAFSMEKADKYFRQAVINFKKSDYKTAAEYFKKAVYEVPSNAKYWSHLALALSYNLETIKDAEQALLKAIDLEPNNSDYYANLGLLYAKQGILQKARIAYEHALRLNPDNIKAKKGLQNIKK